MPNRTVRPRVWVTEPAGFEVREGIVFYDMPPGTDYDLCSTPAVLLESARLALAAYNKFAAENGAEIIRLDAAGRRRARH